MSQRDGNIFLVAYSYFLVLITTLENTSTGDADVTLMANEPFAPVEVPVEVPLTFTETPSRPVPVLSATWPVMVRTWAKAITGKNIINRGTSLRKEPLFFISKSLF